MSDRDGTPHPRLDTEPVPNVGRLATLALAISALAIGIWVRVSNYDSVFAAGSVLPITPDANYHLRRSLGAYAQFPTVPVFDRLMNWPQGAACHWSNGFDFVSAAIARLLAPGGDENTAAGVIVFVPVLLGVLCAAAAAACARRLCEGRPDASLVAQLAWWLALLLPLGVLTSLLGRTDHHVAEALAVAMLCLWLLGRFPNARFRSLSAGRRWSFELAGAGLVAASMALFDGSLLYLAVVAVPLSLTSLIERSPPAHLRDGLAGSGAPAFALGAVATAALYAPNMRVHGKLLSYAFPSLLQPALLAAAALALLSTQVVAAFLERGAQRVPWRRLGALLLPGAVLGAVTLLSPLRAPLQAAIEEHLLRGDPWIQQIEEFKPLLAWSTVLTAAGWSEAWKYFGVYAPGALLLLPLAIAVVRRTQPERAVVFAWLAACILGLSLLQEHFARALWPLLAVWTACGTTILARQALHGMRIFSRAAGPVAMVLTLCGLVTSSGTRVRLIPAHQPPRAGALASVFLSEANSVRRDGSRAGVLTSWSLGHDMMWPAKSGVVANGFLFHVGRAGLEQVQSALGGGEPRALALMQERDLGWLVIGAEYYALARLGPARIAAIVLGEDGRGVVNLPFLQRAPLAVAMLGGGGLPDASVPHLQELVPRWATPGTQPNMAFALPTLWAFERVRGALLVGTATPGSRVIADVRLFARGAGLPYRAWTDADADGSFALRVALWNGALGDGVRSGERWSIHVPGRSASELVLSESDVRAGRTITLDPPAPRALAAP